jgi:hypothetical protein
MRSVNIVDVSGTISIALGGLSAFSSFAFDRVCRGLFGRFLV